MKNIFKNYQEFLENKKENQNGFSQEFLDKNNLTINEALNSLVDCQDCFNCLDCRKCQDCLDCAQCYNCVDCQDSSNSNNCENCISLDKCKDLNGEECRIGEV